MEYCYVPIGVLLISRYSNTIIVIKKESNDYVQYVGNSYSESISISYDKLSDIFDTSGKLLVFHRRQVFKTVLVAGFISS
jgi:hypothetical protein